MGTFDIDNTIEALGEARQLSEYGEAIYVMTNDDDVRIFTEGFIKRNDVRKFYENKGYRIQCIFENGEKREA